MSGELWPEDWLMDDDPDAGFLLSEASLAEAWNRPEEDIVWAYLQQYAEPVDSWLPWTP
jgi:hypothetical protein